MGRGGKRTPAGGRPKKPEGARPKVAITLPPPLLQWVKDEVDAGRFESRSDAVERGLRLLPGAPQE